MGWEPWTGAAEASGHMFSEAFDPFEGEGVSEARYRDCVQLDGELSDLKTFVEIIEHRSEIQRMRIPGHC